MTIRLLHDVGNDRLGAVVVVDDRRARRLIHNGYAVLAGLVDEVHEHTSPAVGDRLSRKAARRAARIEVQ